MSCAKESVTMIDMLLRFKNILSLRKQVNHRIESCPMTQPESVTRCDSKRTKQASHFLNAMNGQNGIRKRRSKESLSEENTECTSISVRLQMNCFGSLTDNSL
jgi:hypothetical protein